MTQTANILFLYRNLADEATVTASTELAGAEATFLQTMDPKDRWRATDKTSEHVTFDYGGEVTATHAALVAHTLNTAGTIQHICRHGETFAGGDLVFDSGDLEAWDPVSGYGFDGYGTSYGGYPLLTKFNDYRALKLIPFGGPKRFTHSRFVLKNPTNADITGVAAGRAFVGLGFQPKYNFAFDWDWEWVDPSILTDTVASLRVKKRQKYRKVRISMPFLSEAEAISAWDDIKRTIGSSADLIMVPFPTGSSPLRLRTSIYGIPIDRAGTRNPYLDVFASTMLVRELAA